MRSTVFGVQPEDPEPRAQWHAVLFGGTLVSRDCLEFHAVTGYVVGYQITNTPSNIYMTDHFVDKNAALAGLLRNIRQHIPTCRWIIADGLDRRQIVLCGTSEAKDPKFKRHGRTVQTAMSFLRREGQG